MDRRNGVIESFDARPCDEALNGVVFCTLRESGIMTGARRRHDNAIRPHGSLEYRPPQSLRQAGHPDGRVHLPPSS
ncbi:MAG: integrase core domain-containing protein [Alphaproteobacteria bacterium]|nr:integrase core domain-containing protein [Alphaproteobacteria bacterium]